MPQYNAYKRPYNKKRASYKKKKQLIMFLSLIGFILSFVVGYLLLSTKTTQSGVDTKTILTLPTVYEKPNIQTKLLDPNPYSRPQTPLTTINGVVIHYVGNPGTTALANRNYFNNLAKTGSTYASSHFIVDLTGTIIQCIPLNEIAYASNDRNKDTISIEVCHPDETGQFTKASYDALISLTRWLCSKYDLDSNEVIRHYDVTGKLCPLYYVENEEAWLNFKNEIFNN